MKELGRRVKGRRIRLGLTQKKLGAAAQRSHSWVVSIEKGTAKNPDPRAITAMAVALGEDPAEYLRLAGQVVLQAEKIIPLERPPLPPGMEEAIQAAVAAVMEPYLTRLERLLKVSDLTGAAVDVIQEETRLARNRVRSSPRTRGQRPLRPLRGNGE